MGLRSPLAAFSPEEFPCAPTALDMPEEDEHYLGTDEESSKESSLQSSLQDSSLTELEGKMASTGFGAGMFLGNQNSEMIYLSETFQPFFNFCKSIFMTEHYLKCVLGEVFAAFKATFLNWDSCLLYFVQSVLLCQG